MSGGPTHLAPRTGNFGLLSRDIMSALWPDKRLSTAELTDLIGPAMSRSRGVTAYLRQRGLVQSVCTARGYTWEIVDLELVAGALLSPLRTPAVAEAHKSRVVANPPERELRAALSSAAPSGPAPSGTLRKRRTKAEMEAARNPRPAPYVGETVLPRRFNTFTARLPTDPGPPLPRAGSMDALRLPSVIGGRLLTQHSPEQLARGGRGLA